MFEGRVFMDAARPRILIVDDDPGTVATLSRSLRRNGRFLVDSVPSIEEAIALLDGVLPDAVLPDAVLLDLSLSVVDGHALLRRVRQNARTAALPVLVLTGRHEGPVIRAAAQAGASAFIPQPLNGAEIAYKIDQAVRAGVARAVEAADLLRPDPTTACRRQPSGSSTQV